MSTKTIVLKSSDGVTFEIEEAIARQWTLPQVRYPDRPNDEILLPNVAGDILALVIEYCRKHHVDDTNPSSDKDLKKWEEDLKKWDEQFMDNDEIIVFYLILAAKYLNIKSLFDLTLQTYANMIDKTPDAIRSFFEIV